MLNRALLFSSVTVHSYAYVEQTVVMPDVNIGNNARIQRAIVDRGCNIPENTVIGENHDDDRQRGFRVTDKGIVLVTPEMLNQSTHSIR